MYLSNFQAPEGRCVQEPNNNRWSRVWVIGALVGHMAGAHGNDLEVLQRGPIHCSSAY